MLEKDCALLGNNIMRIVPQIYFGKWQPQEPWAAMGLMPQMQCDTTILRLGSNAGSFRTNSTV
jgi:hypothetical protein